MDAAELSALDVLVEDHDEHVVFQVIWQLFNGESEDEEVDLENLLLLLFQRLFVEQAKKGVGFSKVDTFELTAFLDVLNQFTYFNVNFDLTYFRFWIFLGRLTWLLVHHEALDHVLRQYEASNGESNLLEELVPLHASLDGHLSYQNRVEKLVGEHQDQHWEDWVPHLQGLVALAKFCLDELLEVVAEELPDVSKKVLVDAFVPGTSLKLLGFGTVIFKLQYLSLDSVFDIDLELKRIMIKYQLTRLLILSLVDHNQLPQVLRALDLSLLFLLDDLFLWLGYSNYRLIFISENLLLLIRKLQLLLNLSLLGSLGMLQDPVLDLSFWVESRCWLLRGDGGGR